MVINTIRFPDIFNKVTGKCSVVTGPESINKCLFLLINSTVGELIGDPSYGANILENVYDHNNVILNQVLKDKIASAIKMYEPRITVNDWDISVKNNMNTATITVSYYIKEEGKYDTYTLSMLAKGDYTGEY